MAEQMFDDSFEEFLKETTNNFRMYPDRKVWYSIYNNLYPGRKWPSVSIIVLFIFSLIYLGQARILEQKNLERDNNFAVSTLAPAQSFENTSASFIFPNKDNKGLSTLSTTNENNKVEIDRRIKETKDRSTTLLALLKKQRKSNIPLNISLTGVVGERELSKMNKELQLQASLAILSEEDEKNSTNTLEPTTLEHPESNKTTNVQKTKQNHLFAYQIYATPSVGFRTSTDDDASIKGVIPGTDGSNEITYMPGLNVETGANVLYTLSAAFRIKAGIQLNYTNYIISTSNSVFESRAGLGNPVSGNETFHPGSFSSGENSKLSNNTYQVSLPIGADFKIAGNSLIEWYAGATLQPTLITGGSFATLAENQRSLTQSDAALRRFNMNGGIETFLAYKINKGLIINAGPQFRYQFLSSYQQKYSYDEKLYNIGVKLGITTRF